MRLDKFLKVSRIIKRRTVAKDVADQGRIMVNDRPAKSSTNIQVGDQVAIRFGNRLLKIEVTHLQDSTKTEDAIDMYRVISEDLIEE